MSLKHWVIEQVRHSGLIEIPFNLKLDETNEGFR